MLKLEQKPFKFPNMTLARNPSKIEHVVAGPPWCAPRFKSLQHPLPDRHGFAVVTGRVPTHPETQIISKMQKICSSQTRSF